MPIQPFKLLHVLVIATVLSGCTAKEVGNAGYQSAKSWCGKTQDHCSVTND